MSVTKIREIVPLSFSQISLFKRCAHRYYWEKERGVRRRTTRARRVLGDYIHKLIAEHARGYSWTNELARLRVEDLTNTLFEEEETTVASLADQAGRIMERYVRHVWEPVFGKWSVIAVEHEFGATLPDGSPVVFKPDLIIRDTDDRLWIVDHKTMKDFPENLQTRLVYDDQINLYLWGLTSTGHHPFGAIHDCIRTREPRVPEITKSGRLSRQQCVTDEETIRRGFGVARPASFFADMEDYIATMKMHKFFDQVPTDRSESVLGRLAHEYTWAAGEIRRDRASDFWPRTFERSCTDCPVRELCMADLNGGDVESLLATTFTQRGEREEPSLPADLFEEGGGNE